MKKIIKSLVLVFFLTNIYSNYPCSKDILNSLSQDNIEKLLSVTNENCGNQRLFQNIKKNKSYPKFGSVKDWKTVCEKISKNKDNERKFFNKNFKILFNNHPADLLTGYYEPTIEVSFNKSSSFRFPILRKNKLYSKVPREIIEKSYIDKDVLLWAKNKVDLFFLQIQGSGIGILENGRKIKIIYSGNNELKYSSIGKYLIQKGELKPSEVSLFTIKDWLNSNQAESSKIMNYNKRFIFFDLKQDYDSKNPVGSFGTSLKPNLSIAVDANIYPIGIPFLIVHKDRGQIEVAISLDTGSAIKGSNRADLFTGNSLESEKTAGELKKKIYLYPVIPYSK